MLTLNQVTKSYGETVALQTTYLEIPLGQTTVLLGPSGCGKSTILRMMIGLIPPDRGEIVFDGKPLRKETIGEARIRMGYVIQDGGLFPHLTAEKNISIMADYLGWEPAKQHARLRELCELSKLTPEILDRYPSELSGGQKQRVSLMRALMLDPTLLLLDEPLGALDPIVRTELQEDLKPIFQSLKKTVVLVTHDLAEAVFFGDQLVLMREGSVVQKGTFQQMVDQPADPFVSKFIRAQRYQPASLEKENS